MDRRFVFKEFYEQELMVNHHFSTHYAMRNPHFHDGFEINLALTDGVRFYIEDQEYSLKAGTVTLINNNEIHYNVAPAEVLYERYIISFLPEFITSLNSGGEDLLELFVHRPKNFSHCTRLNSGQLSSFIKLAERLKDCAENSSYAKIMREKLILSELLLFINEIYAQSSGEVHSKTSPSSRLRPVLYFIREHIGEELSLERLCGEFYLSKSHLIALFKKDVGLTPNEYIVTLRIMKSREYLKNGVPVLKTCELIGYGDESHFIRTFKRITGITPKQYGLKYANRPDGF